jgi:hypothetical protein
MINNLKKAKEIVQSGAAVFAYVLADATLTSQKSGLMPLFELIERGLDLSEGAAADKMVGFAAAVLLKKLNVKAIFSQNITPRALSFLTENGIEVEFENIIPSVLSPSGGMCVFETALLNVKTYDAALQAIYATKLHLETLKNLC